MAEVLKEEVAHVELERVNGKKILSLRVCPELETTISESVGGELLDFKNEKFTGRRYAVLENTPQFKRWAAKYTLNRPDVPLDHNQTYNFSFLFMEGVSKGLDLEFTGLYSEEFMVDYVQALEHFIQEMYNEFVSSISIIADLKLRTVRA